MKFGVSYLGNKDPEKVKQDIDLLLEKGCTHICFPYSEEDFAYYRKTMRTIINQSVKQGLKAYITPYGIGNIFPGNALSEYALKYPNQAQINNFGETQNATCLNQPKFHEYLRNWVNEVTDLDIETILWDIPLFQDNLSQKNWSCRCATCQKLFRKIYSHSISTSLTENAIQFRQNSVFELLSELTGLTKTKQKRNAINIDFTSIEEAKQHPLFDLFQKILEIPMFDEISFQPYWVAQSKPSKISQRYHSYSRQLLNLAKKHKKECQIWVKNFQIVQDNELSVSEATYAAYNEGVRNIFAWSAFGSRACDQRSDNPNKVFQMQTEAISQCLDKEVLPEMISTMQKTND